jgi:hypothetical protein
VLPGKRGAQPGIIALVRNRQRYEPLAALPLSIGGDMKNLASAIAVAAIPTSPVYAATAHPHRAATSVKRPPIVGVVIPKAVFLEDRPVGIGKASRKATEGLYIGDWLEGYPIERPRKVDREASTVPNGNW